MVTESSHWCKRVFILHIAEPCVARSDGVVESPAPTNASVKTAPLKGVAQYELD